MNTAVYLEPLCSPENQEELAMYYGSKINKKFSKFDLSQCAKSVSVVNDINVKFGRYDSGEIEPPKNPSDPTIKTLYDQARSLEHCLAELEAPLDVNALFNLRFYDAVKSNFASFYQTEINQVVGILNGERKEWDSLEKEIDEELAKIDEFAKKIEAENDKLQKNPDAYFSDIQTRIYNNNRDLEAMINNPEKLALLNKLHDPSYSPNIGEIQLYNQYIDLKHKINEDSMSLMYRNNRDQLASMNTFKVSQRVAELNASKENIKKLKQNEIWLPTADNLKNKSRKELRENLHRIDSVLTINSLPRKTRLALEWVKQSQQMHLVYFQNPFEWHEVTAHVPKPDAKVSLAQSVYVPPTSGTLFELGTMMGGMGFGYGAGLNFGQ